MAEGTSQADSPLGEDDEVAPDAIQLITVATFNGLCRLIASLARDGSLTPPQLAGIHDAMITPLDDPDWRDYALIASTREMVDLVLAQAINDARELWSGR